MPSSDVGLEVIAINPLATSQPKEIACCRECLQSGRSAQCTRLEPGQSIHGPPCDLGLTLTAIVTWALAHTLTDPLQLWTWCCCHCHDHCDLACRPPAAWTTITALTDPWWDANCHCCTHTHTHALAHAPALVLALTFALADSLATLALALAPIDCFAIHALTAPMQCWLSLLDTHLQIPLEPDADWHAIHCLQIPDCCCMHTADLLDLMPTTITAHALADLHWAELSQLLGRCRVQFIVECTLATLLCAMPLHSVSTLSSPPAVLLPLLLCH